MEEIFPADAIARAKKILVAFKGGIGAYTDSRGNPAVREEVARFIEKRDGVPSNPDVSWGAGGGEVLLPRGWGVGGGGGGRQANHWGVAQHTGRRACTSVVAGAAWPSCASCYDACCLPHQKAHSTRRSAAATTYGGTYTLFAWPPLPPEAHGSPDAYPLPCPLPVLPLLSATTLPP